MGLFVTATPDGNNVISGGADKQIIITPINAQEIISVLRKKAGKNMKIEDWYRFVGKDIEYSEDLP